MVRVCLLILYLSFILVLVICEVSGAIALPFAAATGQNISDEDVYQTGVPSLDIVKRTMTETDTASITFRAMEEYSNKWLARNKHFLEWYAKRWVGDPLHWWSRVWEYPFIFTKLRKIAKNAKPKSRVLDIGSGVSFFHWYLKSTILRDSEIIALDYDNALTETYAKLAGNEPNAVKFVLADMRDIVIEKSSTLSDSSPSIFRPKSFDIIFSISVLEHTSEYKKIIDNVYTLLKDGGHFLITIDVSFGSCNKDIRIEKARKLLEYIRSRFEEIDASDISVSGRSVLTPRYTYEGYEGNSTDFSTWRNQSWVNIPEHMDLTISSHYFIKKKKIKKKKYNIDKYQSSSNNTCSVSPVAVSIAIRQNSSTGRAVDEHNLSVLEGESLCDAVNTFIHTELFNMKQKQDLLKMKNKFIKALVNEIQRKMPNFDGNVHIQNTFTRNMEKILFFGTRPEIIKLAPLYNQFSNAKLVFTGQHPDLVQGYIKKHSLNLDVTFSDVFENDQTLVQLTTKLMRAADQIKVTKKTIWIVQGDTTTTYAIAYVAFLKDIPLVHIEAGLRTFDMKAPFPEEFNRQSVSLIAAANFAPTAKAANALYAQGIPKSKVFMVGNTGIDAARIASVHLKPAKHVIDALHSWDKTLIFMTMHRRENQSRMNQYYKTVARVVGNRQDIKVLVSLHPNPIAKKWASIACKTFTAFVCVKAMDYETTQWIINRSSVVITDSGGLQEEATWYATPVFVLRRSTERSEAIHAGVSLLTYNFNTLETSLSELLVSGSSLMKQMTQRTLPFGDGHAAEKIAKIMRSIDWHALGMKQIKPNPQLPELPNNNMNVGASCTTNESVPTMNKYSRKFDSNATWEDRYKKGGNSGLGSYGEIARYKADVINELVSKYNINVVSEYGCGDGNNLKLYTAIPTYIGYDVSATAIRQRQKEYDNDESRTFIHFDGSNAPWNGKAKPMYDMTMSLDVLYHLVDINIWETYMNNLFTTSSKVVVIFDPNKDNDNAAIEHVLFRKFTPYVAAHFKCWKLQPLLPEPSEEVKKGTTARFFVYRRIEGCVAQPQVEENECSPSDIHECSPSDYPYQVCSVKDTIDVVLTVWKRVSLQRQLDDVAQQVKKVSHIWIVQNENHIKNVEQIVEQFKESNPDIPTDIVNFSHNSRYHGRFYVAYFMSSAKYVSVWDDDVEVGNKWLEYSISESKKNGNALVGANGRTIESILPLRQLGDRFGQQNDFVGHIWTLPREFIRYYIAQKPFTYVTGEDSQISFALQKHGIISWLPIHYEDDGRYVRDNYSLYMDEHTSFLQPGMTKARNWLLCTLVYNGFKTLQCTDCHKAIAENCIQQLK